MASTESPQVIAALTDLVRSHGVTCLVNVGAATGAEAKQIAEATGCRAICIEGNTSAWGSQAGLDFAVIGATDGPAVFYLNENPELSSLYERNSTMEKRPVMVTRLDTFCRARNIVPDALLIDTEGTTLDVLKGAGDLLDNVRLIYAEVQRINMYEGGALAEEVDAFLKARGFVWHGGLPSYDAHGQANWTWVRPA